MTELSDVVSDLLQPCLPAKFNGTVLVAGDLSTELIRCIGEIRPDAVCVNKAAECIFNGLATKIPYPLAIVVHQCVDPELPQTERVAIVNMLCRIRDVLAEKVLHIVITESANQPWTLADSLAMGFVKAGEKQLGAEHVAVFDFDIRRYKADPDWLNAKHWAHPERWSQSRW